MRTKCRLLALALMLCAVQAAAGELSQRPVAAVASMGTQLAPSGDPEPELFPGVAALTEPAEFTSIRLLYSSLEQAIVKSGFEISFTLDDFRTYHRSDFRETLLLDVLTLHAPLALQVAVTEVGAADGSVVGKSFEPAWQVRLTEEDLAALDEWMGQFEAATLSQVYAAPDTDAAHRNIAALTSYRVRVEFGERSETYRAIAKWIRHPDLPSSEMGLIVEDHVTDSLEAGIFAGEQVGPLRILLDSAIAAPLSGDGAGRGPR